MTNGKMPNDKWVKGDRGGMMELVVYVDVDDTLVRHAGAKRIVVGGMVEHVRELFAGGATLYCWSTGGAAYAREVAEELGIAGCFAAFLPKPQVMIDDQEVAAWRRLVQVHPLQCAGMTVADYKRSVEGAGR
jgi:hypothetical protein